MRCYCRGDGISGNPRRPVYFCSDVSWLDATTPNVADNLRHKIELQLLADNASKEPADLGIIAVEADKAPDAVDQCAARGVKTVVIFSSGFAELGEAGQAQQDRLRDVVARTGIRILGPNCLGAVSVPDNSIATFSIVLEQAMPPAGALGIVSQSGNLGSFAMRLAAERGAGVSRFMTTGNECDVDVADGIAWLARDPETKAILCCLETVRNADRFLEALDEARKVSKPVIVLKVGTSDVGQAAAASHTGALAGSDAVFDAVFARSGAVRVYSVEELVSVGHVASMLLPDCLPKRPRVALLTASGGFGILLADAMSAAGLSVPELSPATQKRVLDVVPFASARNPVDATAQMSSRPEMLSKILTAIVEDDGCDAVVLLLASSLSLPRLRTVYMEALRDIRAQHPDRLVMLCVREPKDAIAELHALGFPTVETIDACATTLASLVKLSNASQALVPLSRKVAPAAPLREDAFRHEFGAKQALASAGIPVLREHLVQSPEAAACAAESVGFPVVMKIASKDLPHKTEVGGVKVGLATAEDVRRAYDDMMRFVTAKAPSAVIDGVLIAPMARGIAELILGTTTDPIFGPVVMVGLGGVFAEIIKDTAVQTAPVSEAEAAVMLRSLKAFPVLDGARGRPQADLDAAAKAVAALSRFAAAHAESVAEIDINPLLLMPKGQGAVALDALLIPHVNAKEKS